VTPCVLPCPLLPRCPGMVARRLQTRFILRHGVGAGLHRTGEIRRGLADIRVCWPSQSQGSGTRGKLFCRRGVRRFERAFGPFRPRGRATCPPAISSRMHDTPIAVTGVRPEQPASVDACGPLDAGTRPDSIVLYALTRWRFVFSACHSSSSGVVWRFHIISCGTPRRARERAGRAAYFVLWPERVA
jgi:hypothetical protein